jgi:1-acyl-sn-glycerol-3-phosphate acyltransferase
MFYNFMKIIFKIYFAVFYRVKISGIENLPKNGGYIICANHVSAKDPLVIGTYIKPKIYFMAKSQLFSTKFKAWFFSSCGAFPVHRGGADITAIKKAIQILKEDKIFGIFPEGRRNRTNEIKPQAGIVMIALKSKSLVVPVGVVGTYKMFSKVIVNFGKPIDLSQYYGQKTSTEEMEKISIEIMKKIKELADVQVISKKSTLNQ